MAIAVSRRPGLSHVQPQSSQSPKSPHTPQRTYNSNFASPSTSYRVDEESVIFEFGARYFRAGNAGESAPRCTIGFGPEESARVGDYRRWLPGYETRPVKKSQAQMWGEDHELWRMDLRTVDLGLVEDKVERAVREAYTRYLLVDQKPRRVVLVLPPIVPHPLLSTLLSTLFNYFQHTSISLLSTPVLSTVAAGLRSALVIDVGWSETLVTAVYEYREVLCLRSTRAMKLVTLAMGKLLTQRLKENHDPSAIGSSNETTDIDFDLAEEATIRMAWARSYPYQTHQWSKELKTLDDSKNSVSQDDLEESDSIISIPISNNPYETLGVPFSHLSQPVESSLFASELGKYDWDNEEQPISELAFKALLSLPPDVRGICISRIILTGGGSNVTGLNARLVNDLRSLVQLRGWKDISRGASNEKSQEINAVSHSGQPQPRAIPLPKIRENTNDASKMISETNQVATQSQEPDPIEDGLRRKRAKDFKDPVSGVIRVLDTLGPWYGASMMTGLKVKGVAEIDRESFLQHGLAGARRDQEISVVTNRQSFGPGTPRPDGHLHSHSILGAFA